MKKSALGYIIPAVLIIAAVSGYLIYKSSLEINLSNGDKLDNISLKGPNGEVFSLHDIHNKYILVHFWASWCGPCVAEVPELNKVYQLFRSQKIGNSDGFEIYAVSLNFDETRWKNSLNGLGVQWPLNVNDTQAFKSEVARKYNVGSIPANVLLNPEYEIVGKNLSPNQIKDMLNRFTNQ